MGSRRIARAREARRFRRHWLCCVKTGEQALTSGLPRHAHEGDKVVGCRARNATQSHAAVAVSVESTPFVVHRDFVEIEQVSIIMAAALLPDAGFALNGIVGSGVNRHPGLAFVIGGGDESVPFAGETAGLIVARDICA